MGARMTAGAFAALLLLATAPAAAQTVYKLIDKNGKVTYSEDKPKDFDGQVIRIDIDPNANRATLATDRGQPEARKKLQEKEQARAAGRSAQLQEARDRVEAARKALADARDNPGPDDIRRVGNAGGGARPVPTEQYQQRLDKLEKDLKEAEDGLRKLDGGREQ